MASSLQQQLAAISAKSTNQLNLKALKERHSRSLLFEPREAAGQTFETIYQICLDGFADLCQLDRRFAPFANNLFAEGSVSVEREHMTAKENEELDKVIEQFLGLVSGRLLLRPAHKSVEWLVRRWKVHEYSPAAFVFAFLPYHDHDTFPTVLSLLPNKIPHSLNFLRPYIASLSILPRHVLASAAVTNSDFLNQYTSFVLGTAARKHQSSIMLGLWASVVARAVNSMLDAAQSGREEVRRQKMEDVMTRVLPILRDTLAVPSSQELFLAACIIITLLASRGQLTDSAIDALMESIVSAWSPNTVNEAIECLILLAEEKEEAVLSRKVARSIIEDEQAVPVLLSLQSRFESGKLVTGLLDRALRNVKANKFGTNVHAIKLILTEGRIPAPIAAQTRKTLAQLTGSASATVELSTLADLIADDQETDVPMIDRADAQDIDLVDDEQELLTEPLELPKLPTEMHSFLDLTTVKQSAYEDYFTWFELCCQESIELENLIKQFAINAANHDIASSHALSFLAAFWCQSRRTTSARITALQLMTKHVSNDDRLRDYQALYPSLLLALCDSQQSIRKAAAQAIISQPTSVTDNADKWGAEEIYGERSVQVVWLPHSNYAAFLEACIKQNLEDSILGPAATFDSIISWLNAPENKTSRICEALASHAIADVRPHIVELLMGIIQEVGKNATLARQTIIAPFLVAAADQYSDVRFNELPVQIAGAIRCMTHRTPEEIEVLKRLAMEGPKGTAEVTYSQIAKVFSASKSIDQKALLGWMIQQATHVDHDTIGAEARNSAANDALRSMDIPVDVLAHQFGLLLNKTSSPEHNRVWKKARIDKIVRERSGNASNDQIQASVRVATLCLELTEDALQAPERKKRKQETATPAQNEAYTQLLRGHFSLLAEVQSWQSNTGSSFAYVQSLALANMAAIVEHVRSAAAQVDVSMMRTDLIVDTLRSSVSPQVHNNALILISKIATLAPDTILHSVMPLFTFMSSSTLRQADAYSAHVISMTIESIVPPLVASLKKKRKDLVIGASDLLLSFTAAYEHIPEPRRVETFVQLLRTLGPEDALHAVLAMLTERYDGDVTLPETLRSILSSFDVKIQMIGLSKFLALIADACQKRRTVSDNLLGFQEKNAAEAHAAVRTLLLGFTNLLQDTKLRKRVAAQFKKAQATEDLRTAYGVILERLIVLPEEDGSIINFNEPGIHAAHGDALEALLRLLPLPEFIESSAGLMQAGTEALRIKVFASLSSRASDSKSGDTTVANVFLDALSNCAAFLTDSQPVAVRQAALLCIDAICEKFGRLNRDAVASVVDTVIGDAALASDSAELHSVSMLCLASAIEVLGENFVSLSANSVQLILEHMQNALAATPVDESLVTPGFTFINTLLDYEAWLLSSADTVERAIVLACKASQITSSAAVEEFCSLAPKKIKLDSLNVALLKTFDDVLDAGLGATAQLVKIEHSLIAFHTKKDVLKHSQGLLDFMLRAFEIRESLDPQLADVTKDYEKQLNDMEAACAETTRAMLDLTLKLNDTTFRPFFIQLVDWARQDRRRAIALFDYISILFEQLGSIVTSYASFVLDDMSTVLKDARKTLEEADGSLLLDKVLSSLSASFIHDQDDFWTSTSHFDGVESPLIELLCLEDTTYVTRASQLIVDLAGAVSSSPELLKSMNTRIMALLRDDKSTVRLAAVKCQRSITEKLTFDWLNMLPEMLPFISELLEDDDEAVEREALRWVSQLEEVTGESLEGMLA